MRIAITTESAVCEIRKYPGHMSVRQQIVGIDAGIGVTIFTSSVANAKLNYYKCRDGGELEPLYYNGDETSLKDGAAAIVVSGTDADFNFLSHFDHALEKKIDEWGIFTVKVNPRCLEFEYGELKEKRPKEKIRIDGLRVPLDLCSFNAGTNSITIRKFDGTKVGLELRDSKNGLVAWGEVWYDEYGRLYVERDYLVEGSAEDIKQLTTAEHLHTRGRYYYEF